MYHLWLQKRSRAAIAATGFLSGNRQSQTKEILLLPQLGPAARSDLMITWSTLMELCQMWKVMSEIITVIIMETALGPWIRDLRPVCRRFKLITEITLREVWETGHSMVHKETAIIKMGELEFRPPPLRLPRQCIHTIISSVTLPQRLTTQWTTRLTTIARSIRHWQQLARFTRQFRAPLMLTHTLSLISPFRR